MTIINACKAKDPATCRFHRPNAGAQAFAAWQVSEQKVKEEERKYSNARVSSPEDADPQAYLDAKWNRDEAEEAYYATDDGLVSLALQIDTVVNDPNKDEAVLFNLKSKYEIAKYHVQKQEEENRINDAAGGPLIPAKDNDKYEPPTLAGGGDVYWPTTTGSNYDKSMTLVQVKSAVNAELKKAQKLGHLPKHVKFAVTARSNNLRVLIQEASPEQIYNDPEAQRHSDMKNDARDLKSRVNVIVNSFNSYQYDEIEGRRNMSKFWEDVKFEDDWDRSRREARIEERQRKAAKA